MVYKVKFRRTLTQDVTVDVEAEDEGAAWEKADDMLRKSEVDFNGGVGDSDEEVTDVTEQG